MPARLTLIIATHCLVLPQIQCQYLHHRVLPSKSDFESTCKGQTRSYWTLSSFQIDFGRPGFIVSGASAELAKRVAPGDEVSIAESTESAKYRSKLFRSFRAS